MRIGDMERQAVDPAAHQREPSTEQERRRYTELVRGCERSSLAPEQVARERETPPWDFIDPAKHGIHLARGGAEAAALHCREQVAFEHDAARPATLDLFRQGH